ncbi:MAG: metal-dependent hydrolase [Planctomycetia bacterium]|nr:metal-dependent hydrolase [Planctomycetia bacterium]
MVENAPYHSLKVGDLTVEGYSRAAVQSYWRIPELKLGFDLGAQPWDFMNMPQWFITHAHLDHMAALPVYIARRRMMKMEPPVIYLPAENLEDVKRLLLVWQRLDRGRMVCELHGVHAGDEIPLSREHVVTVFPTTHTVPSVGFLIWDKRNKLREEYQHLTGEEIRDIRLSGIPVTKEVRTPLVAYTGDTSPAGLDQTPDVFRAKILITEMSFILPKHRKDKIHKFGHMHLDDFLDRVHLFRNEAIVIGHFSTRYNPDQVRKYLQRKLPAELQERMKIMV